jgi:hypothetical protein
MCDEDGTQGACAAALRDGAGTEIAGNMARHSVTSSGPCEPPLGSKSLGPFNAGVNRAAGGALLLVACLRYCK